MMEAVRNGAWAKAGAQPQYDSLVDYIEGPTQSGVYCNAFLSDYIARKGDIIRAKFRLLKFNASGSCLFGSYYEPGVRMSMIHIVNSGGLHPWIGITNGYTCNNISLNEGVDYKIEVALSNTQATVTVGDASQTITASRDFEIDDNVLPCTIMARYNGGTKLFENHGIFRLYELSVLRDGSLFRNWIPARIGGDAILFESVSGAILKQSSLRYANGSYSSNVLYCGPDKVSQLGGG